MTIAEVLRLINPTPKTTTKYKHYLGGSVGVGLGHREIVSALPW